VLLRRLLPPAAAVLAACAPSIQQDPPPASVSYAVFDPQGGQLPQPNDLALTAAGLALVPAGAQKDLLTAFAAQGGFPNDQEVDLTIDFTTDTLGADGKSTPGPADLDVATLTAQNLVLLRLPGSGATSTPQYATPVSADYVKGSTKGTLTLRNVKDASGNGPLPWESGPGGANYVLAVRGGQSGVKLVGGGLVNPVPAFFLLTRGVDLSLPENQTLLQGTAAQKLAQGQQLEQLRQGYLAAFKAVEATFPASELAVLSTFRIAPTNTVVVQTDPGRGLMPLPSDFLLDPATGNKTVQRLSAFGPLAPGIATLDGFSTTAPILATLSGPILLGSVTKDSVFLYDLSNPLSPKRVPDATEGGSYVSEPLLLGQQTSTEACSGASGEVCLTTTIGLQPAVPVATSSGVLALPPLKEATEYVVLITSRVKDATGKAMGRSTLGQTLLFAPEHPVAVNGVSQLVGVSDAQASGLESMRQLLHLAVAQLGADKNIPRDQIVMAYSFRTQTVTGAARAAQQLAGQTPTAPLGLLQLAALPYSSSSTGFVDSTQFVVDPAFYAYSPAEAWTKWGLDAYTPNDSIDEVLHGTITTLDLASKATGAFDPTILASSASTTAALTRLRVLIAVPKASNVAAQCGPGYPVPTAMCAPLLVFHHGLGASKAAMLTVANEFTKRGFVVAAIDGAKHGDRSWCKADSDCAGGGTCVPIAGAAAQGDTAPPGLCSKGNAKIFTNCTTTACFESWASYVDSQEAGAGPDGYATDSANYLVSANFFRTRDTLRQDLIDQSALVLALARPPQLPAVPAANQALLGHLLLQKGILIDPAQTYWAGQSLGAMLGTLNLAANPRLTRGLLNVGGGTLTDVLTQAPAFQGSIAQLLQSQGIKPGTPDYLRFLLVAKWILDPADPINVAGHLLGGTSKATLPDLLGAKANQAPKSVYGQVAGCDLVVPNAFNLNLGGNIGLPPLTSTVPRPSASLTLFLDVGPSSASNSCPASAQPLSIPVAAFGGGYFAVPHAFLTSWGAGVTFDSKGAPAFTTNPTVKGLTQAAQDLGAAFLLDPVHNLPPTVVALPAN
jgi:pimeloyl-ACP methyl ester carboxylesterase